MTEEFYCGKCPKCGNGDTQMSSHPATGTMCTCKCGARGYMEDWNDGDFHLEKVDGKSFYDVSAHQMRKYLNEKLKLIKKLETKIEKLEKKTHKK